MRFPYGPLTDSVEAARVYLDTRKVSTRQMMGGFMQANLKFTAERDLMLDHMVYELATYVRSHSLPPEIVEETDFLSCDHPATWWQQWKHDVAAQHWALRWIARWRPVRLTRTVHKLTITLDLRRFRLYPDAPDISSVAGYESYFMGHTRLASAKWDTDSTGGK